MTTKRTDRKIDVVRGNLSDFQFKFLTDMFFVRPVSISFSVSVSVSEKTSLSRVELLLSGEYLVSMAL
jgi:hypothetical protein